MVERARRWHLATLTAIVLCACRFETNVVELYTRELGVTKVTTDTLRSRGADLFVELGCVGCHRFDGYPRDTGIDLTDIGQRDVNFDGRVDVEDARWLERHFLSPSALRPGSFMPTFEMTGEDATALTLLMLAFRDGTIPRAVTTAFAKIPEATRGVARGTQLFRHLGCPGCHGPRGAGGTRDPNIGGIPGLRNFADTVVSEEELADEVVAMIERGEEINAKEDAWLTQFKQMSQTISNGRVPKPKNGRQALITMPAFGKVLESKDIDALGAYIISIFPKDRWESWD